MSKTPYEIRLDLLKLANEILTTPIFQKREALREQYQIEVGRNPGSVAPYPDLPDFPDADAVIAQASKLNEFVSKT
jgi:hypothetical protein